MNKKALRSEIIERRKQISKEVRFSAPTIILEQLKNMPEFATASIISSFVSFRDELEMSDINQWILNNDKTLLLPYIDSKLKKMLFYKVTDLDSLIRNDYGILEPNPSVHERIDEQCIECVLTPGVAFDVNGYRLGYGGGFYDRLFSSIEKTTPRIGVAFEVQFIDTLPTEAYDQPIHYLVTEEKTRIFSIQV